VSRTGRKTFQVRLPGENGNSVYIGTAATKADAKALEASARQLRWQVRQGLRVPETEETFRELAARWVDLRVVSHRRGRDDKSRMHRWCIPFFGDTKLRLIGPREIRLFYKWCKEKGAGRTTIMRCMALLSRFFNELVTDEKLARNPVSKLDRHDRKEFRPLHDPRKTPFLRRKEDIASVFHAIASAVVRVAFAVGVSAGLRTGELLGLLVEDIDLEARRILVQRSYGTVTKDEEPRSVPIIDSLLPVLTSWLKQLGRERGLVFPPDGHGKFLSAHRLRKELREALIKANLAPLTWYQSTRHTFASHWAADGRPLQKLRDILGHSSIQVTERYAHLIPGSFSTEDLAAVKVDLTGGGGEEKVGQHNSSTTAEEAADDDR